ncbi:3-keto-disaccharide hydrolase [Litorihabitans aurantiacus]|uniref:3-keto-alpha-glucoside-1,2-lyase/3-keto-2-hydroxy-glucal hydratase domain-containing protein n=1 Tax=Litorihabitans aurantiacus TaxID=1930061 RepID=A0AA37XE36_9MICO|nr:DUF1080 domain-containing protein [Litorihabitans aurantiacus]GMA31514.1 hypothetical protein GCM10025875_15060 [Litorihabitans aurantiacus]
MDRTTTPPHRDEQVSRRRRHGGARVLTAGVAALAVGTSLGLAGSAAADVRPDDAAAPAVDLLPVDDEGYTVLFDGSQESFDAWEYAGDGGFDLQPDGTITSRGGEGGGFGTLWFPGRELADFSLKLEFRDDAPGAADVRGNSGVQVRFPELDEPLAGCPTTFNGSETNNLSWIAVNCGHEIQINDSPEEGSNDPRKTGSVYGFADIGSAESAPTPKGSGTPTRSASSGTSTRCSATTRSSTPTRTCPTSRFRADRTTPTPPAEA